MFFIWLFSLLDLHLQTEDLGRTNLEAALADCEACCLTDEIKELRDREKELSIEPDWEIDALMKASALKGKEQSIVTDYVLRMLGLEVNLLLHH